MATPRLSSLLLSALTAFASAAAAAPAPAQCSAQELARLLAADGAAQDQLGNSIAVDGDLAVVGAWLEDGAGGVDAGAAYLFERDAGGPDSWGEVAKLSASDGAPSDAFGWAVDVDGDRVLVGAYRHDGVGANSGKAYLFERDQGGPGAWGEVFSFTPVGAASGDQFGHSVAISGDVAVVGAWRADGLGPDAGAAYVFFLNQGGAGNWGQVKELTASDGAPGHLFGRSVALDGTTVLVGAPSADGLQAESGAAYVFDRNQGGSNNFGQVTRLVASDGASGDNFGWALAVAGQDALVGAYANDEQGVDAGAAYVFGRNVGGGNSWGQVTKLLDGAGAGNAFGYSVALWGNTALVGAYLENGAGADSGAVHAFGRHYGGTNAWGASHHLTASDGQTGDRFGFSVGLSGSTSVVGATHADDNGTNSGAGYVSNLGSGPTTYCTAGTSTSGCQASIAASGLPSSTASFGFILSASAVEGGKDGLFFFGTSGRQAVPWGSGTSFQCVVPPVVRAGSKTGSGAPGTCGGTFQQDLNALWCPSCPSPAKNPGPGAVVRAQFWYRDPLNPSGPSTGLSNAIEFSVCP